MGLTTAHALCWGVAECEGWESFQEESLSAGSTDTEQSAERQSLPFRAALAPAVELAVAGRNTAAPLARAARLFSSQGPLDMRRRDVHGHGASIFYIKTHTTCLSQIQTATHRSQQKTLMDLRTSALPICDDSHGRGRHPPSAPYPLQTAPALPTLTPMTPAESHLSSPGCTDSPGTPPAHAASPHFFGHWFTALEPIQYENRREQTAGEYSFDSSPAANMSLECQLSPCMGSALPELGYHTNYHMMHDCGDLSTFAIEDDGEYPPAKDPLLALFSAPQLAAAGATSAGPTERARARSASASCSAPPLKRMKVCRSRSSGLRTHDNFNDTSVPNAPRVPILKFQPRLSAHTAGARARLRQFLESGQMQSAALKRRAEFVLSATSEEIYWDEQAYLKHEDMRRNIDGYLKLQGDCYSKKRKRGKECFAMTPIFLIAPHRNVLYVNEELEAHVGTAQAYDEYIRTGANDHMNMTDSTLLKKSQTFTTFNYYPAPPAASKLCGRKFVPPLHVRSEYMTAPPAAVKVEDPACALTPGHTCDDTDEHKDCCNASVATLGGHPSLEGLLRTRGLFDKVWRKKRGHMRCPYTNEQFKSVALLARHMDRHGFRRPYGCVRDTCEMSVIGFLSQEEAVRHYVAGHVNCSVRCTVPMCLKDGRNPSGINRKDSLYRHFEQVHNIERRNKEANGFMSTWIDSIGAFLPEDQ